MMSSFRVFGVISIIIWEFVFFVKHFEGLAALNLMQRVERGMVKRDEREEAFREAEDRDRARGDRIRRPISASAKRQRFEKCQGLALIGIR
jgi:hypothetical protein